MKYQIGDKVICNDPQYSCFGEVGTVISKDGPLYMVRFNRSFLEDFGLHHDLNHFEHELLPTAGAFPEYVS